MTSVVTEERMGGRCSHHIVMDGERPLAASAALRRLQADAAFRDLLAGLLAGSPFRAFRWETPPVTAATSDRPFEFVLVDSPGLERSPDPEAFRAHFTDEAVVAFDNVRGDARLVVPCPQAPHSVYVHLAAFLRGAPSAQIHELWQHVGHAAEQRLGERPLWLSTAGSGVAWLHVRLDVRPKYYLYAPYRSMPPNRRMPPDGRPPDRLP